MTNEELIALVKKLQAENAELRAQRNRDGIVSHPTNCDAVAANGGHEYFSRYVQEECKSEEERKNLTDDVETFWDRLKGYQTEANGHRAYGLAVGRVQSGKTRNYIGLMFKAIDDGYNTIIILTSKNNQLAVQTHERVFEKLNHIYVSGSVNGLTQANAEGVNWIGNRFVSNGLNVGVLLKNVAGHLSELEGWLDEANGNGSIRSMKLLVIDDESDAATPNANVFGTPKITSDEDVENWLQEIENYHCITTTQESKYNFVSRWISDFRQKKKDRCLESRDEIRRWLSFLPSYKVIFSRICENEDVRRSLCLDGDEDLGNGVQGRSTIIREVFNRRGTAHDCFNQKIFRDFLNYVFDVKIERSAINGLVSKIAGPVNPAADSNFNYQEMIYAGYTATPVANLLQEDPRTDPLCPDYIMSLSTSSKYFGFDRIFGEKDSYGNWRCRLNIVRDIPSEEYNRCVLPIQNGLRKDGFDENLFRRVNEQLGGESVAWDSLKNAIKWAFCTAAARRVIRLSFQDDDKKRSIEHRWTTMLFNISHLSSQDSGVHRVQQEIVQAFIDAQRNRKADFLNECMAVWDSETSNFSREDFSSACPGYGEINGYPERKQVEDALKDYFLNRVKAVNVIQMNASTEDRERYTDNSEGEGEDALWFVCGGNAISRGLTLKGLTVSYYDRIKRSTAVDSITQMGRWFGYRIGYELLPRIWMTDDSVTEMKNICLIENQWHDELSKLISVDDENPPSFRTGQNAAKMLYFGRRLSGRDKNCRMIDDGVSQGVFSNVKTDSDSAVKETQQMLKVLLDKYNKWERSEADGSRYTKPYHKRHEFVWKNVPKELVKGYLIKMVSSCFYGTSNNQALGLIREIQRSEDSCCWTVIVGNPDTDKSVQAVDGINVHLREHKIKELVDEGIKISHGTQTGYAYLATFPDEIIEKAEPNVTSGDNSGVQLLNKTCEVAEQMERREFLRPMLLIEFIKDAEGQGIYVQVSFYWHGNDVRSYCQAIINPNVETSWLEAEDFVGQQCYISKKAMKDRMGDSFTDELWNYLTNGNAKIGVADSSRLGVNGPVLYSKEWYDEYSGFHVDGYGFSIAAADVIGIDLIKKIYANGWIEQNGRIRTDDLKANYYHQILCFGCIRRFAGDGEAEYKDYLKMKNGIMTPDNKAKLLYSLKIAALKGCPKAKDDLRKIYSESGFGIQKLSDNVPYGNESLEGSDGEKGVNNLDDVIDDDIPLRNLREWKDAVSSQCIPAHVRTKIRNAGITTVGAFLNAIENHTLQLTAEMHARCERLCNDLRDEINNGGV